MITHAHADHLRPGCDTYLVARAGLALARARLPPDTRIEAVDYGEPVTLNGVKLSLHPAGHVLGSAQVRVEHRGEVWVASGDYKLDPDPTCDPFEPIRCHTFISECTFGLPIYRWPAKNAVTAELQRLHQEALATGQALLIGAYALGKAQRVMAMLDDAAGPLLLHGAVDRLTQVYRDCGVILPPTRAVAETPRRGDWAGTVIIAPPSALNSAWSRRFGSAPRVFASGWMTIRGARRRRGVDAGLALSDHADWPGLLRAIDATGASRILLTHGHTAPLVRTLRQAGLDAATLRTEYTGEDGSDETPLQEPVAQMEPMQNAAVGAR